MLWDGPDHFSNTLSYFVVHPLSLYYLIRSLLFVMLRLTLQPSGGKYLQIIHPSWTFVWDLNWRTTPLTSERLLDFCSCGMSHSSVISIKLDIFVIIFLLQTMEILIKRISLNAGMITMFSKQHIQGILMITFTPLSRVQTHTYLVYVRYILRR